MTKPKVSGTVLGILLVTGAYGSDSAVPGATEVSAAIESDARLGSELDEWT